MMTAKEATPGAASASVAGRCLLTAALALCLAACTGLPSRPAESTRVFAPNSALSQWQLRGKIGIRSGDSADSGYLNWLQCGERFEIRINGPLGSGAAKLVSDGRTVTLHRADRPPVSAPNAGQLLAQELGWQLPVSRLHYWIRGLASPAVRSIATADGFEQSGWQLTFPRQTRVGEWVMPAKAVAQHPDLKVTLILQHWELQPECGQRP